MKKIIVKVIVTISILGIGLIGWNIYSKDRSNDLIQFIDRINPLVPEKPLYIQVDNTKGTPGEGSSYTYEQIAYTEANKKVPVSFYAPTKLKDGAYIELDAKGKYVKTYNEVSKENLPKELTINFE